MHIKTIKLAGLMVKTESENITSCFNQGKIQPAQIRKLWKFLLLL